MVQRLDDFSPLRPAELIVLAGLRSGTFDHVGTGQRPLAADPSATVRAAFLRFLLLGGDETCPPHEKGLQIVGAWIEGRLDLEGCRVPRGVALRNCHFVQMPVFSAAIIDSLDLEGSHFPGLDADSIEARGSISLINATSTGAVLMPGARLGGRLNCTGARLECPLEIALRAEALVAHSVVLEGASITGGILVTGARLGADFNAAGLELSQPGGIALNADGIKVQRNIMLTGAVIEGEVRLIGAHVQGDMLCSDARLSNRGHDALQMNRAIVEGGFFLRGSAKVNGVLDMTGATLGTLHDDLACWPDKGDLLLNRCLYDAFIDGSVDAASRLNWLALQAPGRWNEDFWPQPHEQVAKVFRSLGHEEDARTILIEKERLQRGARRARARNPVWRAALGLSDAVLAVTVRYGRQPLLAFVWLLAFWLAGTLVFAIAQNHAAIKPNSAVVLRSAEWTMCGVPTTGTRDLVSVRQSVNGRAAPGQTQLDCFLGQWEASSYPRFSAAIYSLEVLVPFIELDQKAYWRPDPDRPFGRMTNFFFYLQSVVGWALSLLAVAGFSGLVKST
jgi:hypothetical protein